LNLADKYRPTTFAEVVGNAEVVQSLERAVEGRNWSAYLLSGPSGTGKTTMARIIAGAYGATGGDVLEIDAASRSGVGDTRELAEFSRYRGLVGSGGRAIIMDEAHRLSRQAWDALLKPIEEPPAHVVWILCTTELSKVPKTIQTRCATFRLDDVEESELEVLLRRVVQAEGITLTRKVAGAMLARAQGSPRSLLSMLPLVAGAEPTDALKALDEYVPRQAELIDLCRLLAKGTSFTAAVKVCKDLELDPGGAESARRMIVGYFTKVAFGGGRGAEGALTILTAFGDPFPDDSPHHLLLALSLCTQ
jgi:replication-associated recombination protein RarA